MLPWKSIVQIDRKATLPTYLQIVNAIIGEVREGRASPGSKLPGTRKMANLLTLNRKTIITVYEELAAQGWVDIQPQKGVFVSSALPVVEYSKKPKTQSGFLPSTTGYQIEEDPFLIDNFTPPIKGAITFDDGVPDSRMAPVDALTRAYRRITRTKVYRKLLAYSYIQGDLKLREVLSRYLSETRGISCNADQVFITRGSLMGMYLTFKVMLRPGDKVIIGEKNYYSVTRVILNNGAIIIRVPVDEQGISTHHIEEICEIQKIRAVFITPHHHHPTTVTLSADRRMHLLNLANRHRFAIMEDDYDYDFHYSSAPLLPLASHDQEGMVVYVGSFSKAIAPAFRLGYVVGPQNLMKELRKLRKIIDRQGDVILERALAEMIQDGEIQRHLRKAVKVYKDRRNHLCQLLNTELGDYLDFKKPEGGMAIWTHFDPGLNMAKLRERALQEGVVFPSGIDYQELNATRLGFASLNKEELTRGVHLLKKAIKNG